jgi:3-(3-hydroxy-phenyl)propionate hydroxylase
MLERDVVVVGAGPVGLSAALAVRAIGRAVTVIEAGARDRVRPGSRAIFIHGATLAILERIRPGLGFALSSHGLAWSTKRTLYRGREVYRRTYPAPRPDLLPAATSLPQVVTEQVLYDACVSAGVDFIWNIEATKAATSSGRVRVESAGSPITSARYVIGADGARSAMRESSGLRLEGPRTSNAFVIVDTAEDPADPLPVERVFHYEHPAVGYRNVLLVPFAGHWRVDLQCEAGDDLEAFGGADGVRQWLPKVMPAKYAERVTWVSTYVFRQAIASSFVDANRRVLLAGEAAHVFAPFGARGLNSGIADAFVAARAIDTALRADSQDAAASFIDAFAQSRRAAAERNRAASSTALAHLVARSPARRLARYAAAQLSSSMPAMGKWLDAAPYGPPLGEPDREGMVY